MRDINRLDDFYDTIKEYHKTYFPDWRVGQFMYNFAGWLYEKYKRDWFYVEEDKTLEYMKVFLKEVVGIKE